MRRSLARRAGVDRRLPQFVGLSGFQDFAINIVVLVRLLPSCSCPLTINPTWVSSPAQELHIHQMSQVPGSMGRPAVSGVTRSKTGGAASKESNNSSDYDLSHRLLLHWFGITHLGSLKGRWYPIVHLTASSHSLPLLLEGHHVVPTAMSSKLLIQSCHNMSIKWKTY